MIPFEKSEAETRERGAMLSPSCAQRKCNFFVAQRGSASRGRRSPFCNKLFATLGSFFRHIFVDPKLRAVALTGHGAAASLLLQRYASANPLRLPRLSQTRTSWGSLLRAPLQGRGKARRRTRSQGESRSRSTTSPGARNHDAERLRRALADATEALHPSAPLLSRVFEAGEADGSDGCGPHRPSPGMRKASL